MQARIKDKHEVAKGTLMVVFDLLGNDVHFVPGQYFWVELPERGFEDDRGLRRHISIVTSPNERGSLGLATRVRDTAFKQTLAALEVGDEVIVEDPKGDLHLPEDTSKHYVFIAGGIGITVLRCMLKYIAEEGLPYRITLLHPHGQGVWNLVVEPPLLVILVGVLFQIVVVPALLEDLAARREEP